MYQDRNWYNRKYKQRIRTDGFSSGATFRDGCQPDPQCLNPFQLQVDFAFISSPTNCWLSEKVFRFHPMILAKFRQAGRQLCESHEGEVWLSSEKGNSYKFFIVGNGSNNTRITSLPGSFILFGNLVLVDFVVLQGHQCLCYSENKFAWQPSLADARRNINSSRHCESKC